MRRDGKQASKGGGYAGKLGCRRGREKLARPRQMEVSQRQVGCWGTRVLSRLKAGSELGVGESRGTT